MAFSVALHFLLTWVWRFDRISTMNEREYGRLKAEAEAEYRRKLDAIEMVWKLSGGAAKNGTEFAVLGKGSLLKAVRDAIVHLQDEFTVHDVEQYIIRNNPTVAPSLKRPSLSSALKRLEKQNLVAISTKGTGKRASKYRRSSATSS